MSEGSDSIYMGISSKFRTDTALAVVVAFLIHMDSEFSPGAKTRSVHISLLHNVDLLISASGHTG